MPRFAINGRFLTRRVTGVDWYARELVGALDAKVPPGDACVVVPGACGLVDPPGLANIEVVRHGRLRGHAWEQVDYAGFLRSTGALGVSLCNTAPVLSPGVVCVHDMAVRAHPEFHSRISPDAARAWGWSGACAGEAAWGLSGRAGSCHGATFRQSYARQ